MRGARIAEKIQEFYHTKAPMAQTGPIPISTHHSNTVPKTPSNGTESN
jgi:hypothetical protein